MAGSFDLLTMDDYSVIDLSGLEGVFVTDLLDAFDNEKHVIYVECGKFNPTMLQFNME